MSLNAGQFWDNALTAPVSISSSQPIAVGQFVKSQGCNTTGLGDPAFTIVPPLRLKKRFSAVFRASDFPGVDDITNDYINIISDTLYVNSVQLDNAGVSSYFNPMAGTNYALASVPVALGNHVVTSNGTFLATLYGFGNYNSFAFPLGYDDLRQSENGVHSYSVPGGSSLYPNPLCDVSALEISPELARNCKYIIVQDALGKLAMKIPVTSTRTLVKRGSLESGAYFYTLLDEKENVLGGGKLIVGK